QIDRGALAQHGQDRGVVAGAGAAAQTAAVRVAHRGSAGRLIATTAGVVAGRARVVAAAAAVVDEVVAVDVAVLAGADDRLPDTLGIAAEFDSRPLAQDNDDAGVEAGAGAAAQPVTLGIADGRDTGRSGGNAVGADAAVGGGAAATATATPVVR